MVMLTAMHRRAALGLLSMLASGSYGCDSVQKASTTCALPASGLAQGSTVVDLSHAFDEQTIYWPTEAGFVLEKEADGVTAGGYYYASNKFSAPEHGGTHIDAPRHFAQNHSTVDQIPLDRLIGPAVVVDVTEACARDRDHNVNVADFEAWERTHGTIPNGTIVLIFTGFGRYWPDREKYMGTAERGAEAVKKLHFPGLDPDAAVWLVEKRAIHAVGLDTPSIDHGPSTTFDSHRRLFEREVPAFENIANLDQLPATGTTVVALPMKIKGGSGGPLRAVAIVPKAH
ncbi:Kynurenine formamidase [Labilithrix luteola]|uniref:Kynurenine formamidase n=2 Tax=Labilithrix luteola TaxID=1391654 RepID=A0A0K1PUX0_9BACT|nr:Kynurenine formamidase [Labilithrix luteola]